MKIFNETFKYKMLYLNENKLNPIGFFSQDFISIISSSEIIAHFLNDFLQGYPPVKSPNAGKNKVFLF